MLSLFLTGKKIVQRNGVRFEMIKFKNINDEKPYLIFVKKYNEALKAGQKHIEAMAISSYNKQNMEVDSRFVNLKYINGNQFIFFSNYDSPKSIAFESHSQISALFYWPSSNVQIRIRAQINKTSTEYNQEYFRTRSIDKNALAISSNQSEKIESYDYVIRKYNDVKDTEDLETCPDYWGGFSFVPYYFEFWEGNDSRLNRREVYQIENKKWKNFIVQP